MGSSGKFVKRRFRRPNLPKHASVAIFHETLRILEPFHAGMSGVGEIASKEYARVFDLSENSENIEERLDEVESTAIELFRSNEGEPDSDSVLGGWNAYGRHGHFRTKAGELAADVLYRIAEYRRIKKERPNEDQACRLVTIGSRDMLMRLVGHEPNAVLGASHRKGTSKGGRIRAKRMEAYLIEIDAEGKVQNLLAKDHSLKRAREIVASKLVPPWRNGGKGKPVSPDTLKRHKIGRKKK